MLNHSPNHLNLNSYDKIQAISDVKKLEKLEAYMRREEFYTTADVAWSRLQNLKSSSTEEDTPIGPSRWVT